MANHKSAKKRIRSNEAKRIRNRYYKVTAKNSIKKFLSLTDKVEAEKLFPEVISKIDKLGKSNVFHKNKVSNLKSKLAIALSKL